MTLAIPPSISIEGSNLQVQPIKNSVVVLCAISATTRPLTINLSMVETFAFLARSAAALNLFTFSSGVSPGGPGIAFFLCCSCCSLAVD